MNTTHTSPHTRHSAPRSRLAGRERGFTLIELMITAAIIAILAAVAIPSYQDSVWKGKRAEAKAAIFKTLQAEERNFTQSNTYVAYASGSSPSAALPNWSADSLATSRYRISTQAGPVTGVDVNNNNITLCPTPSNALTQCVVAVATVYGSSTDPSCGTFLAMDSIGNKASATRTKPVCWN